MLLSKAIFYVITPVALVVTASDLFTPPSFTTDGECRQPDRFMVAEPLYELELKVERVDDQTYELIATLDLFDGGYVASPFSRNDFQGKFKMEVADSRDLYTEEFMHETPRSSETIDRISDTPVNWVREKTIYRKTIHLNTQGDFKPVSLFVVRSKFFSQGA